MRATRYLLLAASIVAVSSISALAQAVITTVPVAQAPMSVAVNNVTNKIYVGAEGTVTVIDGATNNTSSISIGGAGFAIAVNATTNLIYVAEHGHAGCNNCVAVIDGASNTLQTVVQVGNSPVALAVNAVTNTIYCVNNGDSTVTVIDGATNNTTTVPVGPFPVALAVNSATNKIYVADQGVPEVTVIDGATDNTLSVGVLNLPISIALNPNTNKIYVVCEGGTVTVIDGATDNTTDVTVGATPTGIGVNPVTNQIYVVNVCYVMGMGCNSGSVTVIDGSTNNTSTINNTPSYSPGECEVESELFWCPTVVVDSNHNKIFIEGILPNALTTIDGATNTTITTGVGDLSTGLAYNSANNLVYIPSFVDSTVSIIDPTAKLQLVPITPCRVVDTRQPNGPFGGPPIQGGAQPRAFPLPQGSCNIPSTAVAYSLNVTVVPMGTLGYLTMLPSGQQVPSTSTLNSPDGRTKANAAMVQAGLSGGVSAYATDTTNLILDIDGYFVPSSSSTLAFFPLTPCRVADTRNPAEPPGLGPPSLAGGTQRSFPVLAATSCNIPSSAQAYSLNFTVVPPHALQYLTVWPTGQNQPVVSTLNDPTGTVVANAAIVMAGTSGAINTYVSDNTNLVIDINGYFAPANSGSNPLALYTLQPCRVLDTRDGRGGEFSGELVIDVLENEGFCPPSPQAQGYVLNATVIPVDPLQYLTLWPDGEPQPVVSTLNAVDGAITSNMAIVPTNNGLIDAYATNLTQLLLDISGYFAP
jgi:YVTN family beta-propeller protein